MKPWFRRYDWDVIAGLVAAAVAIVLHLLHIVQPEILLPITLVLVALLLLRHMREEERQERLEETAGRTEGRLAQLVDATRVPDVVLIGPRQLRAASEAFARQARGDMVWFNVCLLMFRPQELFDVLLRPAVENSAVTRIEFVLDEGERANWREHVMPKLLACHGHAKVVEPRWAEMRESVSFILADSPDGQAGAHVSFWGEPFMARTTGRDVPRFILHVQPHSALIAQLVELERRYRIAR